MTLLKKDIIEKILCENHYTLQAFTKFGDSLD